jgi:anti-sigma-K factor RskA
MDFRNERLVEALAARYVFGMMSARTRRRFEMLRRRHARLEREVRRWESRIDEFAEALRAGLVPADLWRRLSERIARNGGSPHRH